MKRISKKVLSLGLVIIMAFCFCVPAFATESSTDDGDVSELFIHVCDLFFDGNGEAYDQDGNDVSLAFYSTFINAYSSKDYTAIKEGCISLGISCIKTHNESAIQPRLVLTKTYEEMSYHLITQNGFSSVQWENLGVCCVGYGIFYLPR